MFHRLFGNSEEKQQKHLTVLEKLKEGIDDYLEWNWLGFERKVEKKTKESAGDEMSASQVNFSLGSDISFSIFKPEEEQLCKRDLRDLPIHLEPTFSQVLLQMIAEKGISETKCYRRSNLDRRLFSKIRSDKEYHPQKNTVFALIIGLKLSMGEAQELLEVAGYSFSPSLKMDVIMEYLIQNKVYDIVMVNEILYSYDCSVLGCK